ncbi:MAG: hypothetical protein ABIO81_13810 [Ginsengibacter sp.]
MKLFYFTKKLMIEVFKTNVLITEHANMLFNEIHKKFSALNANFDLEDCDNILRVKCTTGPIQSSSLIKLLKNFGFHAEILKDEFQSIGHLITSSG